MSAGVATMVLVAEFLQGRGEEGAHYAEVAERFGLSIKDQNLGWMVGALRRQGFLVQVEDCVLSIPPWVECQLGAWMRHPEHGVVKVLWERYGFSHVKVAKLGDAGNEKGEELRVRRDELVGK